MRKKKEKFYEARNERINLYLNYCMGSSIDVRVSC